MENAASLQLLAVLRAHTLSLAPVAPMLEFDRTEHPIRQALLTRPIEHAGGIVRVPDGPGLGIEVDREALARFAAGRHRRGFGRVPPRPRSAFLSGRHGRWLPRPALVRGERVG